MNEAERIAGLSSSDSIDTAEEIALLSATAGVINVRPVEAAGMLPADDPVLIDLQLGAMLYMKKAVVSFLGGGDPAKYAAEIKFITDRGRVTEANIKDFVKQGIAAAVDAEFNKGMRGGIIPAVVYAQWKKDKVANGVDALQIIKDCISNFYINPTRENYEKLVVIKACYNENSSKFDDELALFAARSYTGVLNLLNEDIRRKIEVDVSDNRAALAQAAKSDSELFVFSVRYGTVGNR